MLNAWASLPQPIHTLASLLGVLWGIAIVSALARAVLCR